MDDASVENMMEWDNPAQIYAMLYTNDEPIKAFLSLMNRCSCQNATNAKENRRKASNTTTRPSLW